MKRIFFAGSKCEEKRNGLRTLSLDTETGAIGEMARVTDAKNPIYLAPSRDGAFLYVAEDVSVLGDEKNPGGVSVYRIGAGGDLSRIASYAIAPTVPCHISLSPDGRMLAWAEYREAHAGVMQLGADGRLTPRAQVHHAGKGPDPVRQEAAHCHFAQFTPDGRTLLVCDLGLDRVFAYQYDERDRALRRIVPSRDFVSRPGTGPRHLAFLAGTDFAFLVTELSSTILSLRLSPEAAPVELDRHSLLPGGFEGTTKAAAIRISPDGQWVLASNRGHDSIAAFRIDRASGRLRPGPVSRLGGTFPRDFVFDPDGHLVIVGHQFSNEIAAYAFDSAAGKLSQTTPPTYPMVKPLCFDFRR